MDSSERRVVQRMLWHALTHQPEFLLRKPYHEDLQPACDWWCFFLVANSSLIAWLIVRADHALAPVCYRDNSLLSFERRSDAQHEFQLTDLYQQLDTAWGRVVAVVYDEVHT